MDVHTAQVQASVQQLVMEHGEYAPLELLLATNRLGYEDYRAWREDRLQTLDAVLADGKRDRLWSRRPGTRTRCNVIDSTEFWQWVSTRHATKGPRGSIVKSVRILLIANCNPNEWAAKLEMFDDRAIEFGRLRLAYRRQHGIVE